MPKVSPRIHTLVFLFLGALVALGFFRIVNLSFLSDDYAIIRLITYPSWAATNWTEILRDFYTPLFFHDDSPFYRPMYVLSYGLDFALWGNWAAPYHLTNLALHLVASFFVYLVALELAPGERGREIAVTAAALFALYPVHTEPVIWIAGRVDVICAVFYFPALFFFLRWLRTGWRPGFVLSLAFFALALFSKEMAAALPGLLFLCALYRGRGLVASALAVTPFALVLGAYLAVRTTVLSGVDPEGYGANLQILASLWGLLYRTLHMLVPLNFALLPGGWVDLVVPAFVCVAVLVGVATFVAYRRGRAAGGLLLLLLPALYLVSVSPVFKLLDPDPTLVSARWFYIPSAFIALFIASVLWSALGACPRLASAASAAACVAFLAILLANQSPWLQAGEIAERHLRTGERPDLPVMYKGAHVFKAEITWIAANNPPFKER
jgi:hypothetical protein